MKIRVGYWIDFWTNFIICWTNDWIYCWIYCSFHWVNRISHWPMVIELEHRTLYLDHQEPDLLPLVLPLPLMGILFFQQMLLPLRSGVVTYVIWGIKEREIVLVTNGVGYYWKLESNWVIYWRHHSVSFDSDAFYCFSPADRTNPIDPWFVLHASIYRLHKARTNK